MKASTYTFMEVDLLSGSWWKLPWKYIETVKYGGGPFPEIRYFFMEQLL